MDDAVAQDVVMIIRHGEKPPGKHIAPHGMTADGVEDHHSLTTIGWARAGALVSLFAPADPAWQRAGLYRPRSVFASNVHGPDGNAKREEQTVALLSAHLGVPVNLDHGVGEEVPLISAVVASASPRLISWEHHNIPVLARLLGAATPAPPDAWPDDRFDMIWVFARANPSSAYAFSQVAELLLPGDRADPIR